MQVVGDHSKETNSNSYNKYIRTALPPVEGIVNKKSCSFQHSLIYRKLLTSQGFSFWSPSDNRHLNQNVIEVNNYVILSSVYVVLKSFKKQSCSTQLNFFWVANYG